MESTILLFTNVCVSEITAINMSLTKEDIIKGLKEVTRKLEEGDRIDSSIMGIVEKFLKNFPPPTTTAVNYFYLPLCDLKSAVLVCKRWKGVAENSKLREDKKLVLEEGENMTLSCAVEVARRRKIQTIQAIGLSSDQVKKVAMGMKGYPGLKELDLGGESFGHVGHSPIGAVSPQLFRNAFPNLVNSSRGRRGASDSVRREPGVGGANLRRRLWILSQAEICRGMSYES